MCLDLQVFEPVTEATILSVLDEHLAFDLDSVLQSIERSCVDSNYAIEYVDDGAAASRAKVCCSAT
jgi:hypothetical protein